MECKLSFITAGQLKNTFVFIAERSIPLALNAATIHKIWHLKETHSYSQRREAQSCNKCSYKLTQASSLKQHKLTHTGERPSRCNECSYERAVASTLKTHNSPTLVIMIWVFSERGLESAANKPFGKMVQRLLPRGQESNKHIFRNRAQNI